MTEISLVTGGFNVMGSVLRLDEIVIVIEFLAGAVVRVSV